MIRPMDKGCICIMMEPSILVGGKMINKAALELKLGLMVLSMKVSI